MPLTKTSRFKRRLDAIVGLSNKWQVDFEGQPLANLLEEFELFAHSYFHHLAQGKPNTNQAYELSTALGRLQEEWATISRACEQRQVEYFQDRLQKADEEAREYYNRFRGHKADDVVPIVYYEKLYAITRYVFTRYPLISIPLQTFDDDTQWQGLAHELGHYIYWNSAPLDKFQEVQNRLRSVVLQVLNVSTEDYANFQKQAKLASIWVNWLEEIFADITALLLIGPMYAVSGQHFVEDRAFTPAELAFDDGTHPMLGLRPLIAIETLTWVSEQLDETKTRQELEQLIAVLKERWERNWRKVRLQSIEDSDLRLTDIKNSTREVVQAILGANSGEPASWEEAGGHPVPLGQLIDYEPWLTGENWERVQKDVLEALGAEAPLVADPPLGESRKFQELMRHLTNKFGGNDKEVRKALVSLQLGEEQSRGCKWRKVQRVGRNYAIYGKCRE